MCGICGRYNLDFTQPVSPEQIGRMNATLTHRGPDADGLFVQQHVGLGHRRLSIIDLSGGKQPMLSDDGALVLIFNGEVYNFAALRQGLEQRGYRFATNSDTEVILQLYRDKGPACVELLRGMFAFAIYDKTNNSLFIARDRLGIKPLYYSFDEHRLVFGSEIKALLACEDMNREIDLEAVSDFLTYQYIPAPKSIYRSIRKLPAGHTLMVADGKLTISKYWDLDFTKTVKLSEQEWIEGLQEQLKEAVELRMISDVPLGAFLSGGVDSSLVVAMMSQLSTTPVKTNTIGFNEAPFNETHYARETSKIFNTEHREHIVSMDCLHTLDRLAYHYDEPFGDCSSLPTYYVSKMTREHVTVALSGDGGDENFAGYVKYRSDMTENSVRSLIPNFVRRSVIAALAAAYPKADWLPQIFRAKTALSSIAREAIDGAYTSMCHFAPKHKLHLLNPDVVQKLKGYDSFSVYEGFYHNAPATDFLSRTQYVDIKTYLCDDILTKVDRASMAVGLEARVPLLDHRFMEYAATIPSRLKLNGSCGKYILKKMAGSVLPESILNRRKMGFSIPVDSWFRKELRHQFEQEVLASDSASQSYFNPQTVSSMWKEHQRGIRNYGTHLWSILMFEKWARRFG